MSWQQSLGSKVLAAKSWQQILGSKFLAAKLDADLAIGTVLSIGRPNLQQ
jgi:hypothetical protein